MTDATAGAVYLAANGRQRLDSAQAVIEAHLRTNAAGRCLSCGEPSPCTVITDANATFARYGRLPRRKPGATVPDLLKRVA